MNEKAKMKHVLFASFSLLIFATACAPTPTPQIATAPFVSTSRAQLTITPTSTLTATVKPTGTSTATSTPNSDIVLSDTEILHGDNVASLRSEIFNRIPGQHNQYTEGDYLYSINKNVAPDTIIERLDNHPNFKGPVIYVKLGVQPPPDKTDLQRAYVTYDRIPTKQINGPWGEEHSFVILNAPSILVYRGSADSTTMILSSLLYRPPDWSYSSFGGVKLYAEGNKYYASVYRANKPGSSPFTMDIDSGRAEINLNQKYALRIEVYYDANDTNRPHIRGYLATFNGEGKKVYQFIGDRPCDDHIPDIKGDVSWLGVYTGSSTRGIEMIVGESTVFKLK